MKSISGSRRPIRMPQLVFRGYEWNTNYWSFIFTLASAVLFVAGSSPLSKLLPAMMLSIGCGLVAVPFIQCFAAVPGMVKERLILRRAEPAPISVLREYMELGDRMRVHFKGQHPLRVVAGWRNAATDGSCVFLGQPVVEEFGHEARGGVFAHELAHMKARHAVWNTAVVSIAYCLTQHFLSTAGLPALVDLLVLFSALGLTASMASWACEYAADAIAAKYVGVEAMTDALTTLGGDDPQGHERDSWSHPSLARRISRLQRLAA